MRGTTPARYAGHVCEREYQCDVYASQYAITHVGTQDYQIRRTES